MPKISRPVRARHVISGKAIEHLVCILAVLAAGLAHAADLEEVLAGVPGASGGEDDFMPGVTWYAETDKAYYACSERLDMQTLELWVNGAQSLARARGVPDRTLRYGRNGPVQVLSYVDASGSPTIATYLLLPSDEAHIFRVTPELRIVKDSKRWQCRRGDWRDPFE